MQAQHFFFFTLRQIFNYIGTNKQMIIHIDFFSMIDLFWPHFMSTSFDWMSFIAHLQLGSLYISKLKSLLQDDQLELSPCIYCEVERQISSNIPDPFSVFECCGLHLLDANDSKWPISLMWNFVIWVLRCRFGKTREK